MKALQGLEKEEFRLLFEYVREWNSKPKLCHIAQFVLYHTFNVLPPTEIVQVWFDLSVKSIRPYQFRWA